MLINCQAVVCKCNINVSNGIETVVTAPGNQISIHHVHVGILHVKWRKQARKESEKKKWKSWIGAEWKGRGPKGKGGVNNKAS